MLARYYKYTPAQIRCLTPYQMLRLIKIDENDDDTITFSTEEEYAEWLLSRGGG